MYPEFEGTVFGKYSDEPSRPDIVRDHEARLQDDAAVIQCDRPAQIDALRAMVKLARVLADLNGKIPAEDWESLVEAGAALWNVAMGDYNAEQLTADALRRARRR